MMRWMAMVGMICFLTFGQALSTYAETSWTKEEAIETTKNAFQAQVSLTEQERTKTDIRSILSNYFTEDFIQDYMNEVVMQGEENYIVYATDIPTMTIPFYEYEAPFTFKQEEKRYHLYQFFPKTTEGPVSYDDHYEMITFENEQGKWKVDKISIMDEKPVIEKETKTSDVQVPTLSFLPPYWTIKHILLAF